jgi:peptidoglycan hydrolase-like protein with peptidoglycan-binding domain
MIEISNRPIGPNGPIDPTPQDVADNTAIAETPGAPPSDHCNPAQATPSADPQARFNALFGAPSGALAFYADKNGGSGGTGTKAAPAAQIGGANPPTLKLGSQGPAVRVLQQELNKWRAEQWPRQQPIAENGKFTTETKQAVEEFQKANQIDAGKATKLDLTPNGVADVRVQNRLRLENDPVFAKLDSFSKQFARDIVVNASRDGARSEPLFTLLKDPAFAKIGQQAQSEMLETLKYDPLHPVPGTLSDAALVKEYTKLAADPRVQKLDPRTQGLVVRMLSNAALSAIDLPGFDVAAQVRDGINNVTTLATSPGFAKLPVDEQRDVMRALGRDLTDKRLANSLVSILGSPDFQGLKADEKTAVIRQIVNYPDDRSISNIERMLAKDWFTGQNLEDKQRSLKTIAYLSQHNAGDEKVIDNTLEQLLGIDSDIKLQWADLSAVNSAEGDSATRTYGEADADTRTLTLSSSKLDAGNGPVPDIRTGKMLVLHTVAHEISHIVNKDKPRAASFQHFEIEFRAWTVGFRAEHGHYPTNKDAMERVRQLLTEKDGAYSDIKRAGGKYHDAMMIFSFVQQLTGRAVTAGNLEDILNSKPSTWVNRSRDPDEQGKAQADRMAPLVDGNLDNG